MGKKYHFPQFKYSAQILSQIWFDFPLAIFSPQYGTQSVSVEQLLHGLRGEKIKKLGEKISYIFPQLDFCALFSATIKIKGGKIWYYVPYGLHFFQVSHNFMKHCMIWFPSCHIFPPVNRLWKNNYCMA